MKKKTNRPKDNTAIKVAVIAAIATLFTAIVGLMLPFAERMASRGVSTPVPGETSQVAEDTSADCGALRLTSVNPSALLENNKRVYKLFGLGLCKDTLISISGRAFVGNDPNIAANGQPIEVSNDGTWLTVYISPGLSPDETGQTITVRNPDGSKASLFVGYQR
jgi:hypothetical protein